MVSADNFSALRAATARLNNPDSPFTLAELVEMDQSNHSHVIAFIHEFVHTHKVDAELEAQIWQTLYAYLQQLDHAYTSTLQGKALQQDSELLGKAFMLRLDNMSLFVLYHYLRYQPLPDGFWIKLHEAYQMAEGVQGVNVVSTGCVAAYLQALMLGTVNYTNMLKWEIALINRWLQVWCQELSLDKEYDEDLHLYFVNLYENDGAHRMRDFTPSSSHRYWHVDSMVNALKLMKQQLEDNILPPSFGEEIALPNAKRLVEHLLSEWARSDPPYRRQRRVEDRDGVSKSAQVIHGIFNVCQHVKNIAFASLAPPTNHNRDDTDVMVTGDNENGWIIENESKFGFGAVVKAESNLWLKPGRLIALDYELNPDLTVVGVVRSMQQQSGGNCYAGIEVLSHTPTYVLLHYIDDSLDSGHEDSAPFPALYLSKDDDRNQPAMLVMPSFQFIESGLYQLRTQQQTYRVKLGDALEQQYDWLRARVSAMDKSA